MSSAVRHCFASSSRSSRERAWPLSTFLPPMRRFTSLEYLNHAQFWGWYLRAVHYWGSNFMVFIMTLHMIQVFLFGAYKYPRELTWVSGIFLLALYAWHGVYRAGDAL